MLAIFLGAIALSAAALICLNAEAIGRRLGVMDQPDNERKTHGKETPLVGGLGILIAFILWLTGAYLGGEFEEPERLLLLMIGAAGVGAVGFADDQTPITALSRILLLGVFLGVALAIDPRLIPSHLNWGSFEPTAISAGIACALLAVAATGIVNAVNMADGQNGLVPSMFIIWSLCLTLVGDPFVSRAALLLALLSLVVLFFNLRGRLFLGDCGSYGVTFVLGLLILMAYAQGRLTIETVTVWFFIPVLDCLRLMITRRLEGRSPTAPDTNHFHHRLQAKLGRTYGLVAYILSVAACSFIATLAPHFALVCLIVLTAIYFSFAWLTDAPASQVAQGDGEKDTLRAAVDQSFANVVPLPSSDKLPARDRA